MTEIDRIFNAVLVDLTTDSVLNAMKTMLRGTERGMFVWKASSISKVKKNVSCSYYFNSYT